MAEVGLIALFDGKPATQLTKGVVYWLRDLEVVQ
jgi:hypothetical protein